MNKLILILPLALNACVAPLIAIPVGLAVAIPADRAANIALGGTPGNTITTDDAISRDNGSQYAAARCDLYNGLVWYDEIYFSQSSWDEFHKRNADHCSRWLLYESGELDRIKGE